MVKLPTLRELLDAGVHFGHKTSRWNPNMAPYIFTSRANVHVINLEKTEEKLKEAVDFITRGAKEGKTFVFVGTKKQSGGIVKEAALKANMPYVNNRWLGGTITNFEVIKNSVKNFNKTKEQVEKGETSGFSKSELSKVRKELDRGEKFLAGLVNLEKKPDALILFGSYDEKNALKEAKKEGIPTIAICDTNADPTKVDYPVPANDDATNSIKLIANLFADTIVEGRKEAKIETKEADKEAK